MIASEWSSLEGRRVFTVSVCAPGGGGVEDETERVIAIALDVIEQAGFRPGHIVRSRLFTRNRESRQVASDVRRRLLAASLRGASSSFFDPVRLPEGASVRLDLAALAPTDPSEEKQVAEYDPPLAPPKFVKLGGLVFLSGVTDTTPGLEAQVRAIRSTIRASLDDAGASLRDTRVMSVFLAREESPRAALALVEDLFPEVRCPATLTQVGGYSAPEKRIEIEVTAAPG